MNTLLHSEPSRRPKIQHLLLSLIVHAVFLLVLVLVPLFYYRQIVIPDLAAVERRVLSAPKQVVWLKDKSPTTPQSAPTRTSAFSSTPDFLPKGIPPITLASEHLSIGREGVAVPAGIFTGPDGVSWSDAIPGGHGTAEGTRKLVPPPPKPRPKPVPAPMRVSSRVLGSKVLRKVSPEYPPLASRARVEGTVLLQVKVDKTGHVREVTVLQGHPLLT
ncbi:MAG: TonB family protein, partial [Candidatus Binatia bacterium]